MEIRNNTPRISGTSFGMAFSKPQNIKAFVKTTEMDLPGLRGLTRRRGVKQVERELRGLKHIDLKYINKNEKDVYELTDWSKNAAIVDVISDKTPNLVLTKTEKLFEKLDEAAEKQLSIKSFVSFIGLTVKALGNMARVILFNPKETLPRTLLTAVEHAKKMDKALIKDEKAEKAAMIAEAKKLRKSKLERIKAWQNHKSSQKKSNVSCR